jgi:hypothetical protein
MSQENVEIVRRTIETFNEDGVEATLQHLDPEVEWLAPPEWLEERLYEGHEGIRELASQWTDNIDGYRLDPERSSTQAMWLSSCSSAMAASEGAPLRSSKSSATCGRCEIARACVSRSTSRGKRLSRRLDSRSRRL